MDTIKTNSARLTNIQRPVGNSLTTFIINKGTYLGLSKNYDDKGNYDNSDNSLYKVSDRTASYYLLSSTYSPDGLKKLINEGEFIKQDFEEAKKAREIYSNNLYLNNQKDGHWIEFFENNKLTGLYENGKKEGEWRMFSNDDVLLKISTYKDNLLNGTSIEFFNNNSIKSSKEYKDGKLDGKTIEYFDENNILFEGNYKNGLLNGEAKEYFIHTDGSSSYSEGYYVDSERQGLWKAYDKEGNLYSEQYYTDGKEDGIYKQYTKEGILKYTEEWEYGEQLDAITYYSNGQAQLIEQWSDGNKNGIAESYYENGNLKEILNYKDNKLDGEYLKFDEIGTIIEKKIYENDILMKDFLKENNEKLLKEVESINNSANEKINQIDDFGKQGKWIELDENLYRCEGNYKDGKKEGLWQEEYGFVTFKGNYKDDKRDGEYIVTSTNKENQSIIVETGQYSKGAYDGNIKIYDDYSNLKYEREYNNGVLNKETEFNRDKIYKITEFNDKDYDVKEFYNNGKVHYHNTPNLMEEFYDNGNLKKSIEKEGKSNTYNDNGELVSSYKTSNFKEIEKININEKETVKDNPWEKSASSEKINNPWEAKVSNDKDNQWER